jgi:hypothetical protein
VFSETVIELHFIVFRHQLLLKNERCGCGWINDCGVNVALRDEVTGGWRKLHNEELHNLYSSPNIIRMIKSRMMLWAGHVACMREMKNVYKISVGQPEGRRPLKRPRLIWEDNIKMDLREIGLEGVD